MRRTHRGYTLVIPGDSCGGDANYPGWVRKHYQSLTVEFIPGQSGGGGLHDPDGNWVEGGNELWDKYCAQQR